MSGTLADRPKVKALKELFGDKLRIAGDGGPDPKDCILLREVKIYEGIGTDRRLVKDQLVIQALNADGKPVSFHKAKWDRNAGAKLIAAIPELGAQLTGGEGGHRAQKLASIVPSVAANPNMHALESLTPGVPLPTNPKASDFSGRNPKALPTVVTWIDASDPARPRRVILLIEQNVGSLESPDSGTRRVDMGTVSYELGAAERATFADGDVYKRGFGTSARPALVEGTSVRVKNADPNGYVSGAEAAAHHAKTIDSAFGCLAYLNQEFDFKALGPVAMTMIDILQNPPEARVDRNIDTGTEMARAAVRAPEVDSGEMRTVSTATVVPEYDKSNRMTGSKLVKSEVLKLYKNIDARGLAEIRAALGKLHRFVGRVAPERPRTMLRPRP